MIIEEEAFALAVEADTQDCPDNWDDLEINRRRFVEAYEAAKIASFDRAFFASLGGTNISELPPDPEEKNGDRASWAAKAIAAFRAATGSDAEDALCDLLADLMHWADRTGYDFDHELERGRGHYREETAEAEAA